MSSLSQQDATLTSATGVDPQTAAAIDSSSSFAIEETVGRKLIAEKMYNTWSNGSKNSADSGMNDQTYGSDHINPDSKVLSLLLNLKKAANCSSGNVAQERNDETSITGNRNGVGTTGASAEAGASAATGVSTETGTSTNSRTSIGIGPSAGSVRRIQSYYQNDLLRALCQHYAAVEARGAASSQGDIQEGMKRPLEVQCNMNTLHSEVAPRESKPSHMSNNSLLQQQELLHIAHVLEQRKQQERQQQEKDKVSAARLYHQSNLLVQKGSSSTSASAGTRARSANHSAVAAAAAVARHLSDDELSKLIRIEQQHRLLSSSVPYRPTAVSSTSSASLALESRNLLNHQHALLQGLIPASTNTPASTNSAVSLIGERVTAGHGLGSQLEQTGSVLQKMSNDRFQEQLCLHTRQREAYLKQQQQLSEESIMRQIALNHRNDCNNVSKTALVSLIALQRQHQQKHQEAHSLSVAEKHRDLMMKHQLQTSRQRIPNNAVSKENSPHTLSISTTPALSRSSSEPMAKHQQQQQQHLRAQEQHLLSTASGVLPSVLLGKQLSNSRLVFSASGDSHTTVTGQKIAPPASIVASTATLDRNTSSIKVEEVIDNEEHQRRKNFPERLMDLLSLEDVQHIIHWLSHGKAFMILRPKVFATDIMPSYFRQAKYASFTRKLNRWGFRQITKGPEQGAFHHELFLRDKPLLCLKMFCGGTAYPSAKSTKNRIVATSQKRAAIEEAADRYSGDTSVLEKTSKTSSSFVDVSDIRNKAEVAAKAYFNDLMSKQNFFKQPSQKESSSGNKRVGLPPANSEESTNSSTEKECVTKHSLPPPKKRPFLGRSA